MRVPDPSGGCARPPRTGAPVVQAMLVAIDFTPWIAVFPEGAAPDLRRLARALDGRSVRAISAIEAAQYFDGCEVGAVPPFGGLYGLPVVADAALRDQKRLVFHAGARLDAIELRSDDWFALEQPRVGWFAPHHAARAPAPTIA